MRLPGERVASRPQVYADGEALAAATAATVAAVIRGGGPLRLVLAGGTTPKRCYEILAGMSLNWGQVTVFFGDERCVGPFDPKSNYRLAFEALLRHVAPASVHRMAGELGAEEGAARHESGAAGPLDLVLLGLGSDGYTASLFPGNPALAAGGVVAPVHGAPKPPPDRITLTSGTLRAARRVIVLAGGADKREAVRRAIAGEVPSGMVQNAEWHVTADAFG